MRILMQSRRTLRALMLALGVAWCIQTILPEGYPSVGAADPATPQTPVNRAGTRIGSANAQRTLTVAVSLNPRDPQAVDAFLQRLNDPTSPDFHKYLTPVQFTDRFFDPDSRKQVADFLRGSGLTVADAGVGSLIAAMGNVAQIEKAFTVTLSDYRDAAGNLYVTNDAAPAIPSAVATKIHGVIGLDTAPQRRPHFVRIPPTQARPSTTTGQSHAATGCSAAVDAANGTGAYTPNQVATAYDFTALTAVGMQGQGGTIALFELDDYLDSAVTDYQTCFGTAVPVTRIPVDGGATRGGAEREVELDIDVVIGMAPKLANLLVYEGPNTGSAIVNQYQRIANDNRATVVSTSWGLCEPNSLSTDLNAENMVFQQMAAQGQTVFAASGDFGSDDCGGSALNVDDPASQPYVTGVGGTALSIDSGDAYAGETVWNDGSGASGGGVSQVWPEPTYQSGPGTANSYSNGKRQVPDLAAMAAPSRGYLVFTYDPSSCQPTTGNPSCFEAIGGTSVGAPLWAAGTALVNQYLTSKKKSRVGFANPAIYTFLTGASSVYHDVTQGNNCFIGPTCGTPRRPGGSYPATAGYDQASGVGSLDIGQFALNAAGADHATLSASPVAVPFGSFSVKLNYTMGGGIAGALCVSANGGAEWLFAGGASGAVTADFIQSGRYRFNLYPGTVCAGVPVASTTVQKLTPDGTAQPSALASPTTFAVAPGTVTSSTTYRFDTGDGTSGQVFLSVNGDAERLFASATYGAIEAPWIQSGSYAFRFVKNGQTVSTTTVTAQAGLVANPGVVPSGGSAQVTANSGTGAPVLVCVGLPNGQSQPVTLGNSGVAAGTLSGLSGTGGSTRFTLTAFQPADGKTPLGNTATGSGQCTANVPLVAVPGIGPVTITIQ